MRSITATVRGRTMKTGRASSSEMRVRRTYRGSGRVRTKRTRHGMTGRCTLVLILLLPPHPLRLVRRLPMGVCPPEGDRGQGVAASSPDLRPDLQDVRLVLQFLRRIVIVLLCRGCPLGEGRPATARAGNQPRREAFSRTRRRRYRRGTIGRRRPERGNRREEVPAIPPEGAQIRHPGGS